ncbi:MAG: hypothetical protein JXC85_05570 [Candidatus Aenigmarchaeota archaeon]|nr:hypothetical protein [Candidatus Aenigmarchaeota archaeon]
MAPDRLPNLEIDKRSGYGFPDLVRLFLAISKTPKGRTSLMKDLGLGEATVKTMLKYLRERGLVDQGTRGVYPTRRGASAFSFTGAFSDFREIRIPQFSKSTVALVVKGAARKVTSGIEQRDEGVRFGAKIITLVRHGGRMLLAGVPNHKTAYAEAAERSLKTEDGDVIILSGADSRLDAERAAVAAGLSVVASKSRK